jgi:hypothetical protein
VLGAGAAAAVVSAALLPLLRFDFNPLHLRNPQVESMATLADLMADPDRTPNTIDVLAPSLAEADALARRLAALPEVARAVTLSSFIPARQEEKLAFVGDAAALLAPTFDPVECGRHPRTPRWCRSLRRTVADLRRAAEEANDRAGADARSLAAALDRLADGEPRLRAAAARAVLEPLGALLRRHATSSRRSRDGGRPCHPIWWRTGSRRTAVPG